MTTPNIFNRMQQIRNMGSKIHQMSKQIATEYHSHSDITSNHIYQLESQATILQIYLDDAIEQLEWRYIIGLWCKILVFAVGIGLITIHIYSATEHSLLRSASASQQRVPIKHI